MTGWPYLNGEPLRCAKCGTAPAVRLTDRTPGPWCARHLPWTPVAGRWAVGKCVRCEAKGARTVAPGGRVTGPWCGKHRPAPQPFGPQADVTLAGVLDRWST